MHKLPISYNLRKRPKSKMQKEGHTSESSVLTLSSSNAQNVTSSPESNINITVVTSAVPLLTTSLHSNSSSPPATVLHDYQLPPPPMSTAISAEVPLVSSTIAVSSRHSAAQHTERMPGIELYQWNLEKSLFRTNADLYQLQRPFSFLVPP